MRKQTPSGNRQGPPRQREGGQQRVAFPRERKVPATVTPNRESKLRYSAQGDLAESFVVVAIAGDNFQQQLVFHRPIGVTPLAKDEWICSLQQDIPFLILRKEDPEAESRKQKVQEKLYALAVETLAKDGENIDMREGAVYINGKHRPSLLHHARQHAKVAGMKDTVEGGPPPYLKFLESKDRVTEMKFIFTIRNDKLRVRAEAAVPGTGYETFGGASNDKPQEAVPFLKGKDRLQAYDAMLNRLYATVYAPLPGEQSGAPPTGSDDQEETDQTDGGVKPSSLGTSIPSLTATEFTDEDKALWGLISSGASTTSAQSASSAQSTSSPTVLKTAGKEEEEKKLPSSNSISPSSGVISGSEKVPPRPPNRRPKGGSDTQSSGSGGSGRGAKPRSSGAR